MATINGKTLFSFVMWQSKRCLMTIKRAFLILVCFLVSFSFFVKFLFLASYDRLHWVNGSVWVHIRQMSNVLMSDIDVDCVCNWCQSAWELSPAASLWLVVLSWYWCHKYYSLERTVSSRTDQIQLPVLNLFNDCVGALTRTRRKGKVCQSHDAHQAVLISVC